VRGAAGRGLASRRFTARSASRRRAVCRLKSFALPLEALRPPVVYNVNARAAHVARAVGEAPQLIELGVAVPVS